MPAHRISHFTRRSRCAAGLIGLLLVAAAGWPIPAPAAEPPSSAPAPASPWTLERCLETALEKNHARPASRFSVAAAEAQHRQALSGYWPQVVLTGGYQRMDESPDFLFPAKAFGVPAQSISTPAGVAMVTVPAGVLGPNPIQLPVSFPGQTISVPGQMFEIPAQDVKLMNPDSFTAVVRATWLLYDGGMRRGLSDQARAGTDAARAEARRTDLEIVDSVTRIYSGAVLARQLHTLGKDTLARMNTTLGLTEMLFKEGAGTVTKTDYLDNKVMVESIRSMVALLEKNEAMAQAALANTMGLSWRDSGVPADTEVAYQPSAVDLEDLVGSAFQFNPDWARLEAGLRAADGAVRTARSGYFPKVALTGELHRWWNDYEAGITTDRNKKGWTAGLGLELPLFDGFLTQNKVREARARAERLGEQKFLLQEGIGLQIKDLILGITAVQKAHQATLDAMNAARENRDLTIRAYQNGLVATEKVIRAQLIEALMSAQYDKTRFDHAVLHSQLNLVVGTEINRRLAATP